MIRSNIQGVKISNDLFCPGNLKCVAINNFAPDSQQKNFLNSVQNVRNTLGNLERSIRKSNQYEQQLLRCKGSHSHTHSVNEWWDSEQSEEKSAKHSNATATTSNSKTTRIQDDYTDSWSTMSILCLQFQYEELAKRYKALIEAYDAQSREIGWRDKRLAQWRQRANTTHAHLAHAHNTLLTVGEKYLALNQKRHKQKNWYEEQLTVLRKALHDIVDATTRAQMKFDERLEYCMANEHNSSAAILLYEIRRCNLLFLENMRLKAYIEEISPGHINWKE